MAIQKSYYNYYVQMLFTWTDGRDTRGAIPFHVESGIEAGRRLREMLFVSAPPTLALYQNVTSCEHNVARMRPHM